MTIHIAPFLPSILAATNFSAEADRAVDRALLLGRSLGRQTIVQHVVEVEARLCLGRRSDDGISLRSRLEAARKHLAFEIAGHQECVGRLSVGSVADEIERACRIERCEMIVIGGGEHSLCDLLLQRIAVPVLIVRTRARYAYRSLIVPTDFSPAAQRCVEAASEYFPDTRVTLLHAGRAAPWNRFVTQPSSCQDGIMARQNAFLRTLDLPNLPAVTVSSGPMPELVRRFVDEHHADLLVVAARKRRLLGRPLPSLSSVCRAAPCDILIVPFADRD